MKTILIIGQQYNDWTILSYEGVDYKRRRRYLCRCKCGVEKSLVASSVFAGLTKKCRDCKASDLKGRRFYDWEVIERRGSKNDKSLWLCKCKCGKEALVTAGNLISGTSKRCFDCGHNVFRGSGEIPSGWWIKQVKQAQMRNREWAIDEEYAMRLFEEQNRRCALSNLPLGFSPFTASLDRIDSTKDYVEGNVQWVHKHLNIMKHKYDQNYFVEMCRLVATNFAAINS